MLPTTQRPVKFMLRYETRVDNLHKKHAALHVHIPSRRLLEGGGVVRLPQGLMRRPRPPQPGSLGPAWILSYGVRHTFFPLTHTKVSSTPLAIRRYLRKKKLPRQAGRLPTLNPGMIRSAFARRGPRMLGNRISMRRGSRTMGRQGGQSHPPAFHFPLTRGRRSERGLRPLPFRSTSDAMPISLSFLMCPRLLAGGMIHLSPCDIRGQVSIP
jgi:hypothetical protein